MIWFIHDERSMRWENLIVESNSLNCNDKSELRSERLIYTYIFKKVGNNFSALDTLFICVQKTRHHLIFVKCVRDYICRVTLRRQMELGGARVVCCIDFRWLAGFSLSHDRGQDGRDFELVPREL